MRRWLVIALVAVMLIGCEVGKAWAMVESNVGSNIIVANEYISIIVNGGEENTGRFSINTTGGDPDRIGDENKPLVYNMTSVDILHHHQIDGHNYVFGGPTQTSAGKQDVGELSRAPRLFRKCHQHGI